MLHGVFYYSYIVYSTIQYLFHFYKFLLLYNILCYELDDLFDVEMNRIVSLSYFFLQNKYTLNMVKLSVV